MDLFYRWFSISGSTTEDNRDFCGIQKNENYNIYILADGSTGTPNSGSLAKDLVNEVTENLIASQNKDDLINQLKSIHQKLRFQYVADTSSFLLAIHFENGEILSLHSGDCLLGTIQDATINWQIAPHTLANATLTLRHSDLAQDPTRSHLTRTFTGRKFFYPEFNKFQFSNFTSLIIASDGFWADLSVVQQIDLVRDRQIPSNLADDVSFLLIQMEAFLSTVPESDTQNLVIFKSNNTGNALGTEAAETTHI